MAREQTVVDNDGAGSSKSKRPDAVGAESWSDWFQCAKEAWAEHWASNQVELCHNNSSESGGGGGGGGSFRCMVPQPGRTKEPWFCHGGGGVVVNFTAIDFDRIGYSVPTTQSKFKLPVGFLSPIGCAAPDPMVAPAALSGDGLPLAATLRFLLPGGISWTDPSISRCTKVVRGRMVCSPPELQSRTGFMGRSS